MGQRQSNVNELYSGSFCPVSLPLRPAEAGRAALGTGPGHAGGCRAPSVPWLGGIAAPHPEALPGRPRDVLWDPAEVSEGRTSSPAAGRSRTHSRAASESGTRPVFVRNSHEVIRARVGLPVIELG